MKQSLIISALAKSKSRRFGANFKMLRIFENGLRYRGIWQYFDKFMLIYAYFYT
jgi:hypothetical protein